MIRLSAPDASTTKGLLSGPAYEPPYDGAVQDEFAWHIVKYLREDAVLHSEVELETALGGPAQQALAQRRRVAEAQARPGGGHAVSRPAGHQAPAVRLHQIEIALGDAGALDEPGRAALRGDARARHGGRVDVPEFKAQPAARIGPVEPGPGGQRQIVKAFVRQKRPVMAGDASSLADEQL